MTNEDKEINLGISKRKSIKGRRGNLDTRSGVTVGFITEGKPLASEQNVDFIEETCIRVVVTS